MDQKKESLPLVSVVGKKGGGGRAYTRTSLLGELPERTLLMLQLSACKLSSLPSTATATFHSFSPALSSILLSYFLFGLWKGPRSHLKWREGENKGLGSPRVFDLPLPVFQGH